MQLCAANLFRRGDNGIFKLNVLFIPFQGSAAQVMEQYNSFLRKGKDLCG